MIHTVEEIIDGDGMVHLAEVVQVESVQRSLVTILEEEPLGFPNQESLLSEQSLAKDWENRKRIKHGHTCSWLSSSFSFPIP